jgi:hypothetical protein
VIKDETADKLTLSGHLVLHVHYLNHVEVNTTTSLMLVLWSILRNSLDSIYKNLAKWITE